MIERELSLDAQNLPGTRPSLGHELRTPLNQIIGYSEMLVEQARDNGQEAFTPDLEKILAASKRMLTLLDRNAILLNSAGVSCDSVAIATVESTTLTDVGADFAPILVVDDDEGNRDVLSRRLNMMGYTVAQATNGREALEMLTAQSFDLVLLDVMMPEVDGIEVLRQMKASEQLRDIPVLMISALSDIDSVTKCIEMGAEDYLPKPFDPVLLKARIGACLDKKRGHDREMDLYRQLQENFKHLQDLESVRDDLTHMIIHDLRTPLSSVSAAMQTLDVVGEVNDAQREVVKIAVDGAAALLDTINSLLDVEKLEEGAMDLDITLISLPEFITASFAQVTALAGLKQLHLVEQIVGELPWLQGDENKLQRTLVNLLGNAIKFSTPGGTVTLQVWYDPRGQTVDFCVKDTGEGIPAEDHSKIFEKYGQVSTRVGGRQASTGLGLAFCKLVVEAHGGHITVQSTLGQGSNFCFSIPVSRPESD